MPGSAGLSVSLEDVFSRGPRQPAKRLRKIPECDTLRCAMLPLCLVALSRLRHIVRLGIHRRVTFPRRKLNRGSIVQINEWKTKLSRG